MIIHSDNAIAPVGYLRLNKLHLIPKEIPSIMRERLSSISLKDADGYVTDPGEEATEAIEEEIIVNEEEDEVVDATDLTDLNEEQSIVEHPVMHAVTSTGWMWCGGIAGHGDTVEEGMENALEKLQSRYASNIYLS